MSVVNGEIISVLNNVEIPFDGGVHLEAIHHTEVTWLVQNGAAPEDAAQLFQGILTQFGYTDVELVAASNNDGVYHAASAAEYGMDNLPTISLLAQHPTISNPKSFDNPVRVRAAITTQATDASLGNAATASVIAAAQLIAPEGTIFNTTVSVATSPFDGSTVAIDSARVAVHGVTADSFDAFMTDLLKRLPDLTGEPLEAEPYFASGFAAARTATVSVSGSPQMWDENTPYLELAIEI